MLTIVVVVVVVVMGLWGAVKVEASSTTSCVATSRSEAAGSKSGFNGASVVV